MLRPTASSDMEELIYGGNDNKDGNRFTSAGNEADVEDNVQPCTLTPEEVLQKLTYKPEECCPTTPCRIQSARGDFMKNKSLRMPSSTYERLTHRPKSALDTISDTIIRPEGVVPPLALPSWHCLPLDNKIPGIPAPRGMLYYTPGKMSTKLHRKHKLYSTLDPYNRERVVGSPYTALHDPHAKDFIQRPLTRELLYNQGLINDNDEVMYSLKEFNKFRDYLRTLYTDNVHENVHAADVLWKAEREQIQSIRKSLSATEGKEAERRKRLNRVRWYKKESGGYLQAGLLKKQKEREARLDAWATEQELIKTEKVVRNMERRRLQKAKLRKLEEVRHQQNLTAMNTLVQRAMQGFDRMNQEKQIIKQAQDHFMLEWMSAKIQFSKERVDRTATINVAWHESLRTKARRRQRRMEQYREQLPKLIQKRKEYEAYRWKLARKYFNIWLKKTREIMTASHKDSQHESVFLKGASHSLEQTVAFLRFQSGTEDRLDQFILNILRLKEEIKKQLALEEEDEIGLEHPEERLHREVMHRLSQHYTQDEIKALEEARNISRKSAMLARKSKKSILKLTAATPASEEPPQQQLAQLEE